MNFPQVTTFPGSALPLWHLPSTPLRSIPLHPPTWQREMPALPPTGRQSPSSIKLRSRQGPGADKGWCVERKRDVSIWPSKQGRLYTTGQRRQAERKVPGPTGLVGPALPHMFTLEPSVCGQTSKMRPEQQWPRSITSTPRRAPGSILPVPGLVSVRGQKGHSPHKNQGLAHIRGHTPCIESVGRQVGTTQSSKKMKSILNWGQEKSQGLEASLRSYEWT